MANEEEKIIKKYREKAYNRLVSVANN